MTADQYVDAALADLSLGESLTQLSLEDIVLQKAYNEVRSKRVMPIRSLSLRRVPLQQPQSIVFGLVSFDKIIDIEHLYE